VRDEDTLLAGLNSYSPHIQKFTSYAEEEAVKVS
jgi:hypothetical protein